MDQMAIAGIKVILDIPGTPIPLWAHQAYPGITLVSEGGTPLYSAERYMADISAPDFRRLQLRIANRIMKRHAKHPAVIAAGCKSVTAAWAHSTGHGLGSAGPAP